MGSGGRKEKNIKMPRKTIIKLQQTVSKNGVLPKPYFISSTNGLVQIQKYWAGKPFKLLGFSKNKKAGKMEVKVMDFFFSPKKAIHKYPVFETKDGKWYTSQRKIASIEKMLQV